ncbi:MULTISPECIES: AAA family ATPase [unclassified Empedobacter]|uniref:AAA family ATPase n=1 Tax=unclassified Empedobacter TaxID=2643773 RepID=UPI0025C03B9B|nr:MULTISPECIES: AAA family ATPase [unclassified Empedobacter]
MNKLNIAGFKIEKLFGYLDVDLKFDEKYKILIGENGLGKTTILNALYYLLEKKFEKLNDIVFDSIELTFDSKKIIKFNKIDLEFYLNGRNKNQENRFYELLGETLKKPDLQSLNEIIYNKKYSDFEKRIEVVDYLNKINFKVKAPNKYIYDNVKYFIVEQKSADFNNILEILEKNVSSKILYFPTYRRIESQLNRLRKDSIERFYWEDEIEDESEKFDDNLKFGMDDVKDRINNLTEEIRSKSLVGFSKITGDLLGHLSNEFKNYRVKNRFDKNKLEIILNRVEDSINKEDKIKITQYIESGDKSNKGLLYFIDKLIDLYNEQETLDLAIKNFAETCNNYLNFKKFDYDESSISLKIVRENSDDIIELDQLSSGEKQIVSLFSKIYLDLEKSFYILLDEPELSLSIIWQSRLLPDIVKSNKCDFLFTVTHSPFIYDNDLEDYAYGLINYIKFN